MVYRSLVVAVVGLHLVYLGYLVAGGYLAWRWPRSFSLHLVATGWGAFILVTAAPCPLTSLENALRTRGGQARLDTGFIDTYVTGVLYPAQDEGAVRVAVALVVAVSWTVLALRRPAAAGPSLIAHAGEGRRSPGS
jgi:hypothetical protein